MTSPEAAASVAALLSTALISLAPNLILFLFPRYAEGSQRGGTDAALSIGQALAAGGLLGDVFLHTLPHALADGADGDAVGMTVLVGFGTFLVLDAMVRGIGSPHCHDHHHRLRRDDSESRERERERGRDPHHHGCNGHGCEADRPEMNGGPKEPATAPPAPPPPPPGAPGLFTSTILLNLAADSLHNFTDGLAVGASFAASAPPHPSLPLLPAALSMVRSRGGLAAASIMFHEIPHELGDFAVLVSSGFSRGRAIAAQFSTAIAAFAGTAVGLYPLWSAGAGGGGWAGEALGHDVLLPFTAGGFVYLAAASIIPGLMDEPAGTGRRTAQVAAFAAGVAFMRAVAELEHRQEGGGVVAGEHVHEHGHHHHHQHHLGEHNGHHHHHHHHHEL